MNIQQIINQQHLFLEQNDNTVTNRINLLKKLLETIKNSENKLFSALHTDLRKCEFESFIGEISPVYDEIKLFIKKLKKWSKPKKVRVSLANMPAKGKIIAEPYGTVLIYSAWNYPFYLSMMPLIGAIATGNSVVLKPSELAPNTAKLLQKIISETFENNHCSVINGDANLAQSLMDYDIDLVCFTGSTTTGHKVYQAAAKKLIPAILELGGKSPAIISENCNLKVTIKRLVWSKFMNAGQTCVAPDYLLVDEKIISSVIKDLTNRIHECYGEDNEIIDSVDFPRVINDNNFKRLENLITSCSAEKIIPFGENSALDKFIAPTIILNPNDDSLVMNEEIFGPILPIKTYKNINDALQFIKSKPKPLACYLFTENNSEVALVEDNISTGAIGVNECISHLANSAMPFGGVGHSGIGAYHGYHSFTAFSHFKPVHNKTTKIDLNLRYAPYLNKIKTIQKWLG